MLGLQLGCDQELPLLFRGQLQGPQLGQLGLDLLGPDTSEQGGGRIGAEDGAGPIRGALGLGLRLGLGGENLDLYSARTGGRRLRDGDSSGHWGGGNCLQLRKLSGRSGLLWGAHCAVVCRVSK